MTDTGDPRWGLLIASFAVSAFVTWLSILYARQRGMFDQPGQRRSHVIATPRGGGIGIVIAALVFFCGPFLLAERSNDKFFGFGVALALILVAAIGWLDDHRPLSARIRILVHFAAAFLLVMIPVAGDILALPPEYAHAFKPTLMSVGAMLGATVAVVALLTLIVVWSINLHNFMDGINGILACHAIFVFAVLGAWSTSSSHQLSAWVLSAATLGFLPFNFPRARIFMGDVGSGALGLLIVVIAGLTLNTRIWFVPTLLAVSAFLVDSTCTLLSRMLRGRRWYSAHREHLYQWMTRTGMSHARVVAWYMGWNLLVVLPVLVWITESDNLLKDSIAYPASGRGNAEPLSTMTYITWRACAAMVGVYLLAIAVWVFGRRWCLHKVKSTKKQKI